MELVLSDELLGTFVPIIIYWVYSGFYAVMGNWDSSDEYRLHPRSEEVKNIVSKLAVVKGVLVQQAFQIVVALCLFAVIIPKFSLSSMNSLFKSSFCLMIC